MNLVFSYTRISDVVDGTVPLNGFVFTIRRKKTVKSYSTSTSRQLYIPPYLHRMYYLWQLFWGFLCFFIVLNNGEYNVGHEWYTHVYQMWLRIHRLWSISDLQGFKYHENVMYKSGMFFIRPQKKIVLYGSVRLFIDTMIVLQLSFVLVDRSFWNDNTMIIGAKLRPLLQKEIVSSYIFKRRSQGDKRSVFKL